MKNISLLLLIILGIVTQSFSQPDYKWNNTCLVTSSGNASIRSIANDKDGNILATGWFSQSITLDGSTAIASNGSNDIFFAKYSPDGSYILGATIGGASDDNGFAITSDGEGNIYIGGRFQGVVNFAPSVCTTTTLTSSGNYDGFLAKYDVNGAFQWVKKIGASGNDEVDMIDTDASNNVYCVGSFINSINFNEGYDLSCSTFETTFNATSGGTTPTQDGFVCKYNSDGEAQWVMPIGSTTHHERTLAIDYADDGYLYVGGSFRGTTDFDPGAGTTNLMEAGGEDAYIAKYDVSSSPSFLWVKSMASSGTDLTYDIAVSGNYVYATGAYSGTLTITGAGGTLGNAGGYDMFLVQYNTSGSYSWSCNVSSSSTDYGLGMDVDDDANVYVSGSYSGSSTDFDPDGSATYNLSATSLDAYALCLDKDKDFKWAYSVGNSNNDLGYTIVFDNCSFYTGGYISSGAVDFDPDSGNTANPSSFNGVYDGFLAKYYNDINCKQKHYAELKDKLDGGFLQLEDDYLRFKFMQEYAADLVSGTIVSYKVYDYQRTSVMSGNFTSHTGANWLKLLLNGTSSSTFYTLEFTSNKGEKYLLKFKTKP